MQQFRQIHWLSDTMLEILASDSIVLLYFYPARFVDAEALYRSFKNMLSMKIMVQKFNIK